MSSASETSLLAILLVAASPRLGPQLLFQYPPSPNPQPRLNKPVYPKSTDKKTRQRLYKPKHARRRRTGLQEGSASDGSDSDARTINGPESDDGSSSQEHWRARSQGRSPSSDEEGVEDESPAAGPGFAHLRGDGPDHLSSPEAYTHFLGIESSLLASLLVPGRKEMRDTKLELVVDHLSFIGHPVHLDRGREKRMRSRSRSQRPGQQQRATAEESPRIKALSSPSKHARPSNESARNSPVLSPTPDSSLPPPSTPLLQAKSLAAVSNPSSQGRPESDSVSSTSPLPPQMTNSMISSLGDLTLPPAALADEGSASVLVETLQRQQRSASAASGQPERVVSGLEAFNIVLVVDTPPDRHLSNHLHVYYQDIVLKLTAAIKYEELRNGWLSAEASTAIKVKEDAREQGRPLASSIEGLMHCSSLCSALAEAFEAISNRKIARLTSLNHHIDMQLLVHDERFGRRFNAAAFLALGESAPLSMTDSSHGSGLLKPPEKSLLAPHQTLIPLEDPVTMLQELEQSAPTELPLTQFLEILTPTLNFQEYATLLDIELPALQAMVNHLIYWRKARISNVISLRNCYTPLRNLDLSRLPALAEAYSRQFSTLPPLISVLASLQKARPFHEALQVPSSSGRRAAYINMLVWLLSKDLVTELRVYHRLVANTEVKWRASLPEATKTPLVRKASSDDSIKREDARVANGRPLSSVDSPTSSGFGLTPLQSPAHVSTFTQRGSTLSEIREYHTNLSPVPIPGQTAKPPSTRNASGLVSSASFRSDGRSVDQAPNTTTVISEPGEPNTVERAWLTKIIEGKSPAIAANFDKIRPYLDGRCDWEELLFRSQLTRREVKAVLDSISDHLITFTTSR